MIKNNLQILVDQLKRKRNVEIHSCAFYPPLTEDEIAVLTKHMDVPASLMEFYSASNGFQLSYTFSKNRDFNKEAFGYYDEAFPKMWPNENYWHLDGCINILPLDFILLNNWKDYIWFDSPDGSNPHLEFEKKLFPFDVFSKESIAAMQFIDGDIKIYLSSDHNATYLDYPAISMDNYLAGVISTKGSIVKRSEIFINNEVF